METATVVERREAERYTIPDAYTIHCDINVVDALGFTEQVVSLPLHNLSKGGMAILDKDHLLIDAVGMVFDTCRIHLPDQTKVLTKLEIRNAVDMELPDGSKILRLGCRFLELPAQTVQKIQRYVHKLEQEHAEATAEAF